MSSTIVKIIYGEEVRRAELPTPLSFDGLQSKALELFKGHGAVSLKIRDGEGDLITIGTDAELSNAIAETDGTIRVVMFPAARQGPPPHHRFGGGHGPPNRGPRHPHHHGPHRGGDWHAHHHGPHRGGDWHAHHHGPHRDWHGHGHLGRHGYRGGHGGHHRRNGHHQEQGQHLQNKEARKNLARFVSMHPADGAVVLPGSAFTKTWRVRNDTAQPWPSDSLLLFVGGEESMLGPGGQRRASLRGLSLQPSKEGDIKIDLVAPTAPGRYTAYFKLKERGERRFGQRLWCDIHVMEGGAAAAAGLEALVFSSPSSSSSSSSSESSDSDSDDEECCGGGGWGKVPKKERRKQKKERKKLKKEAKKEAKKRRKEEQHGGGDGCPRTKKRARKLEKQGKRLAKRRAKLQRRSMGLRTMLAKVESRIDAVDEKIRGVQAKLAACAAAHPVAAVTLLPPPPAAIVAGEGDVAGYAMVTAAELVDSDLAEETAKLGLDC